MRRSASAAALASSRKVSVPAHQQLKHQLRRGGTGLSPTQALAQFATIQSADIVLPATDGREIRLRRVAKPTPVQQRLLDQSGMTRISLAMC